MSLAPWSHIVRGGESEAVPATTPSPSSPSPPPPSRSPAIASPESSSRSPRKPDAALPEAASAAGSDAGSVGGGNAARGKKPAWSNKPSNGVLEAGPVMGAVLWPALSESARTSPRSSSDSLKVLAEGSVTPSQVFTNVSSPQKPITTNPNPNLNPNNTIPVRQKPMKRGGAANNGMISLPPVVPPQPSVDAPPPQHTSDKVAAAAAAAVAATVPQSSPRDVQNKNNNSGSNVESGSKEPLAPQFHNGNSHPRNSFRRGSGGGPSHNNYGNRRDNDRPNQDWNHQRSSGGRDGRMQHHRFALRNFHRPQPVSPLFVSPSPIRANGNHMGYPEMPSPYFFVPPPPPESFRGVPYPHVVPPVVFYPPLQDPQLLSKLVKQIDYYFSQDNLCKDLFLRQNMDEQGWVPISLIAGFNRIKHLTKDAHFILVALHNSSVVEVNGDKVRKQNDWMNWLLPANQIPVPSSSATNNLDRLATGMQSLGLEASSSGESKNN